MNVETSILDMDVLGDIFRLSGDDEEFIQSIADTFVDRAREVSSLCESAAKTGDRREVETLAHEMRSSSGQIGALRLHELSIALEELAIGNEDLAVLSNAFGNEIGLACEALVEAVGKIQKRFATLDPKS